MIEALLGTHVDDISPDFSVLSTADNYKDFVKSYFAGTVAAGTAYLAMVNDGYVWSDHFENAGGGSSTAPKSPDFVFCGPSTGVALVEAKGSRSAALSAFDTTVRDGYKQQVEPHLGSAVGGVASTHGFCIGSYLRSTTKAEVRIHHTDSVTAGSSSASNGEDPEIADLGALQRHSYATAFRFAHGTKLGESLRSGNDSGFAIFYRFQWLGRNWLSRFGMSDDEKLDDLLSYRFYRNVHRRPCRWGFFAIEEGIATIALARYFGRKSSETSDQRFEPLPKELIVSARFAGDEMAGAIFPDGLAFIGHLPKIDSDNWIIWNFSAGRFEPLNPR